MPSPTKKPAVLPPPAPVEDVRIFADLSPDLLAILDAAAEADDRPRSAQVRKIIKEWAAKQNA